MRDGDRNVRVEWIAVCASVLTFLTTMGGWIWWGGRLSQRVDTLEAQVGRADSAIASLRAENSHQASEIAVTKAQYAEIINQLNRIYMRLDTR